MGIMSSSRKSWIVRAVSLVGFGALSLALTQGGYSQSGPPYEITQSVIAGGGVQAAGGTLSNIAINGEPVSGRSAAGGPYTVSGGFFQQAALPPAVIVTISGRVLTSEGRALRGGRVILRAPDGSAQTAQTSDRGRYVFANVAAGQTYTVTVVSRRHTFTPVVITVTADITGLDLIGSPGGLPEF